jgi:phage gpG-like protein
MTSFTITVDDKAVQEKLKALSDRGNDMSAVFETIGAKILERINRRFETSTGPDGVKWKANTAATLAIFASRLAASTKSKRKKDGSLNAKGLREYANKKPLIASGVLKDKMHLEFTNKMLTISTDVSTRNYAAIQQFGGKTGRGHKVTIPARPYFPIRLDGTLYPDEQAKIMEALNEYLMQGL